ncbi:hypothetical protein NE237_002407 [Protea cynaroides]|uniref:Uncharacterized protein n=1 Tax=Protea cynaroides TaxID=273540 RepID=A0A9Q0KW07_9MAGN|nr:hypothetical protein NE237_002407 [Protea cynaroides]
MEGLKEKSRKEERRGAESRRRRRLQKQTERGSESRKVSSTKSESQSGFQIHVLRWIFPELHISRFLFEISQCISTNLKKEKALGAEERDRKNKKQMRRKRSKKWPNQEKSLAEKYLLSVSTLGFPRNFFPWRFAELGSLNHCAAYSSILCVSRVLLLGS